MNATSAIAALQCRQINQEVYGISQKIKACLYFAAQNLSTFNLVLVNYD